MWKAEKIELTKNEYHNHRIYFEGWYSLIINDVYINSSIFNPQEDFPSVFQDSICFECGAEGCNRGGMLMVRKHGETILFLPAFDDMDEWAECSGANLEGDSECPPHKWFTDGILVVEGEPLRKLLELVPAIVKENIREVDAEEMAHIERWEALVKEQPKGFTNSYYLENNEME